MNLARSPIHHARLLLASSLLVLTLAACKSSGGGGNGGGGGDGGSAGNSTTTGGSIGALTHCSQPLNHCIYPGGLFKCVEYADADTATYQSLCEDGGGTWESGYCDETGAVGQCLPFNYCKGMGIGFVTDASLAADAKQSCKDTGGTWQDPMPM